MMRKMLLLKTGLGSLALILLAGCIKQGTPAPATKQPVTAEVTSDLALTSKPPSPGTTPTSLPTLAAQAGQDITLLCLLPEETYADPIRHSYQVTPTEEMVSDHLALLTKWFSQAGIEVVSQDQACQATLRIELAYFALGETYHGAPRDLCFTGASVEGRILLEELPQGRGVSHIQAEQPVIEGIISSCPLEQQAPIEVAWAEAVLEGLARLWGSEIPRQALLEQDAYKIQIGAARALGNLGNEAWSTVPTLYAITIDPFGGFEKGATRGDLDSEDTFLVPEEQATARYALEQIIGSGDDAIQHLLSSLQSEQASERAYAAIGLAWLMPEEPQVVQALIDALRIESDDPNRHYLLYAIGKYEDRAGQAVPVLIELLNEVEAPQTYNVLRTVGYIGPAAVEAIPVLIEYLEKDDWQMVSEARAALERITGQELGTDPNLWRQWWNEQ
jgi:hypothetical protein